MYFVGMNATEYTVRGFFTRWLEAVRTKRKPKTYQSYSDTLRLYVKLPDNAPLSSVTPLDIEDVLAALSHKSPRVRQLTHAVLRSAFAQAVAWKLISSNPVDGVEAPKVPRKEMKTWTAAELRRFLEHVRGDRYELLFRLAAETGWREGELLALRWSDFDWQAGTVTCARTLTEISGRFSLGTPKTEAGKRSVVLNPDTALTCQGHFSRSARDLVFHTREGTPISKSNFYKHFQQLVATAGVPRIRFHDIRHTNATLSLINGVDAVTLARRLGHKDGSTSMKLYGHFTKEGDRNACRIIGSFLKGDGK